MGSDDTSHMFQMLHKPEAKQGTGRARLGGGGEKGSGY